MSERLRTLRHCIFTGRGRNGERQLLRWFPAETFAAGLPLPSAHSVRSHLPQGDGFSGDGNVYLYHKRRPLGGAGFAQQRLRGYSPQRLAFAESGAANAVCRYVPSREKAILENPQIFQNCEILNNYSADDAQSNAERIPNRFFSATAQAGALL